MAILTEQADYARELAAYLASKEEFYYKPVIFTDEEAYLRFERDNPVEILLCEQEPDHGGQQAPDRVCILSEYSTVSEEGDGRIRIFKYQSSEKLMRDIIHAAGCDASPGRLPREQCARPVPEPVRDSARKAETAHGGTELICVCSPVGGSGCSTYAFALAEYLAGFGKTLFISFDPFFRAGREEQSGTKADITGLLYLTETTGDSPPDISAYVTEGTRSDCIKAPSYWLDLEGMKPDTILRFCDSIEASDIYSHIVFDIGRPQTAGLALIARCDRAYVCGRRSRSAKEAPALAEWKRQLEGAGRADIAEKLTERMVPDDRSLEGGSIPADILAGSLGGYIRETEGTGHFG